MRIPLPMPTRLIIATTHAVRQPGTWLLALAAAGVLVPMLRDFARRPQGARTLFSLALRVPQLGGMLHNGTMARYCGALEALISAGMDLPRAFKLSAHASGNPLLAEDAEDLVDAIMEGGQASEHMLANPELYPPSLVQMVIAGEQAARLPEMFARAAAYYEMEAAYQIDALSASLEPLLLAGVSGLVGTIVISIFLPMYGYLEKLGS
jgi:type IV pilus assembly protein PilC